MFNTVMLILSRFTMRWNTAAVLCLNVLINRTSSLAKGEVFVYGIFFKFLVESRLLNLEIIVEISFASLKVNSTVMHLIN